jgi:hypothetical protein
VASPPETELAVKAVLASIRRAWREGPLRDMEPFLDPDVVFVFPGFGCRVTGREELLKSYEQFAAEAQVKSYREDTVTVDGGDRAALAEVAFEMVYAREGQDWRASGHELWALERRPTGWVAFYRTMQCLAEELAGA